MVDRDILRAKTSAIRHHRYGTLDYELLAGNLARGIEEMETFLSSIWERA